MAGEQQGRDAPPSGDHGGDALNEISRPPNGARSNGELLHEGGGVGRRRPGKRGCEGRVLRGVPHRRGCGAG
eukprot:5298735-Prymnesium_polylepis.1